MNQDKIKQWRRLIKLQKASGLSIIAWCQENNYTEAAFHYWRRQINKSSQNSSEAKESQISFAEVAIPQTINSSCTALHLMWKDLSMDIATEEDAQLAAVLLKFLQEPC